MNGNSCEQHLSKEATQMLMDILAILKRQERQRLLAQTQIPVSHPQRPGDAF